MKTVKTAYLAASFALLLPFGAFALDAESEDPSASANTAMVDGEVRKVDKGAGKVTIKHGPITSLNMPAMTMVFRVKEPSMLDQVTAGDKIKFSAEKMGGAMTVTKLEPAK